MGKYGSKDDTKRNRKAHYVNRNNIGNCDVLDAMWRRAGYGINTLRTDNCEDIVFACSGCERCVTCPNEDCSNSPNYKTKEYNLGGKSLDLSDYKDSFEGFIASEDEYIKYMKKCETKRKVRKAIKVGSALLAIGSLVALAITNEDIKKSVEKTAKEIKKICK